MYMYMLLLGRFLNGLDVGHRYEVKMLQIPYEVKIRPLRPLIKAEKRVLKAGKDENQMKTMPHA